LPKSSDEKEKKKKKKKLSEATSSTSGTGNIAQQLLPSAILDKPLLKLAEIFRLGHTNDDGFAIKCAQEYIHSVDDFIALRYEELLDIFELEDLDSLVPSDVLTQPLQDLARICRIGHGNDDAFAIACMQQKIYNVRQFLDIRFDELDDFFEYYKIKNEKEDMPKGVLDRIRNGWLYMMDRFRDYRLKGNENNIKNWDQNNFDDFDLDLCYVFIAPLRRSFWIQS